MVSPREEFSGKTIMTVNQTVDNRRVEKTAEQDAKSAVDTLHTHDDTIGFVSVLPVREKKDKMRMLMSSA